MSYLTYPSDRSDVSDLVARLRPHDRAEVTAVRGTVCASMLWDAMQHAEAMTVRQDNDGRLVCMYGVGPWPEQEGVGIPWLLGTVLLDSHMRALCRQAGKRLGAWHRKYPILTNYTDKRNLRVLRWLRWLGFHFVREVPVGPDALPFIQFVSNRSCATQ